jgi:glucose/arabinose dehydrogenase
MPNGVALREGDLYVAEVDRIWRYGGIVERLSVAAAEGALEEAIEDLGESVQVIGDLPDQRGHGWKYIAFGPDGRLYVPVGAPCNVCLPGDPFASILRMDPESGTYEVFARGIRNTVGFDWHPETGVLWFTDNGRDYLGDNRPPDEVNRAPRAGLHFRFPFVHGSDVRDPEFGGRTPPQEVTPPVRELGPHVAALGMEFYTGSSFPPEYHGQVFIAEHGSWNRSSKIGYRVMLVRLEGAEAVSYEPFARGWLQGESAWGRPVDLEVLPDGSLLVSDDYADQIYRIYFAGEER